MSERSRIDSTIEDDAAPEADFVEDPSERTPGELAVRLQLLTEENERLRSEYARAMRPKHERAALGLGVVGLIALLAGVAFPTERTVLFALGGVGLFIALLSYYLTPERFIPASVGERTYAATAENLADVVSELGLQETHVYVPVGTNPRGGGDVRLFVPQRVDYDLPPSEALRQIFVISDDVRGRGLSVRPIGIGLYDEFRMMATDGIGASPWALTASLADGLVDGLELVDDALVDVNPDDGRASIAVTDSAYGPVDRFDHPVASFVATGLAIALDVPIELDVIPGDGRADYVVTCSWSVDDVAGDSTFTST